MRVKECTYIYVRFPMLVVVDYVDSSREYELDTKRKKKSRYFSCYFCTFFFWHGKRKWSGGVGKRTKSIWTLVEVGDGQPFVMWTFCSACLWCVCTLYVEGEVAVGSNSFLGYEIKLMFRYHSIFHFSYLPIFILNVIFFVLYSSLFTILASYLDCIVYFVDNSISPKRERTRTYTCIIYR